MFYRCCTQNFCSRITVNGGIRSPIADTVYQRKYIVMRHDTKPSWLPASVAFRDSRICWQVALDGLRSQKPLPNWGVVVWHRPQNQTSMRRARDSSQTLLQFVSQARSFFNVRLTLHRVLRQLVPYESSTDPPPRKKQCSTFIIPPATCFSYVFGNRDRHRPCNSAGYC